MGETGRGGHVKYGDCGGTLAQESDKSDWGHEMQPPRIFFFRRQAARIATR